MTEILFNDSSSVMITLDFKKDASSPNSDYISGTTCVHVKRDPLGLPMLLALSFLPRL